MNLTEKGKSALNHALTHYPTGWFSAAELSAACGEKIAAATLTAIVNKGYMLKEAGTPVKYHLIENIAEIMTNEASGEKGVNNSNLHRALKEKDDEFYTLLFDIEKECANYSSNFYNQVIYLNCDDENSKFWVYFKNNFNSFNLKQLIATHYNKNGSSYMLCTSNGIDVDRVPLKGDGDFRSEECVNILEEADMVITNPPFSLFRQMITLINKHSKQYLLIGNENSVASTEVFPLIKEQKIWFGYNKVKSFVRPDGTLQDFGNICWFTNLPTSKVIKPLPLKEKYDADKYLQYDNYEAINVDKVSQIPQDYFGIMGVPITYLNKHNPQQFEILGLAAGNTRANGLFYSVPYTPDDNDRGGSAMINGVRKYSRVFIRRKEENND